MEKLKNLLPADTRILEITTSIAAVISCILMSMGVQGAHPEITFLFLSYFIIGILQFCALVFFNRTEKLRVICSLIMGALMVYFGIDSKSALSFTQLVLGAGSFYAFLLNNQRIKWK